MVNCFGYYGHFSNINSSNPSLYTFLSALVYKTYKFVLWRLVYSQCPFSFDDFILSSLSGMGYTVVPPSRTVPLGDTPIPNANTWSVEAQSCGPPGHCYCQGNVPLPRGPLPMGQSMTNGWLLWAQKSPVPWPQFRTT